MNRRWVTSVVACIALPLVAAGCRAEGGSASRPAAPFSSGLGERELASTDPIERGCALPVEQLRSIRRGFVEEHSEDVTMVPLEPNFAGTFDFVSHTGPWPYVQEVPLVFYGPGLIGARGEVDEPAEMIDVFPTIAELTGIALPGRAGRALDVATGKGSPDVIVTVVWDGAGSNVLARWPDAWPNLERIIEDGVGFPRASVGSSPSITPSIHANLGTGAYPRAHGVSSIQFRDPDGKVRSAFARSDPRDLELTTFADVIDRAESNRSIVGLVGWKHWHLGMLGHGTALRGGDADHYALILGDGTIKGNERFYSTPGYLLDLPGPERRADELDREDGSADGEWMGHPILDDHNNPAWVRHQGDVQRALLRREGYGRRPPVDLLFVNYKATDLVGHVYTMDSPEMEAVLRAQDEELGRLVGWLERNVADYALVVTADHGHTPDPEETGAWAIAPGELAADIDRRFGARGSRSLIEQTHATGLFLHRPSLDELAVSETDIARFLNSYTLRENAAGAVPDAFAGRADENLFAAAWPSDRIDEIVACASGRDGRG